MTGRGDLFERLVETCGLSPLFAKQSMTRALRRAGVDPDKMNRADLARALPEIERTVRAFITEKPESVIERVARLARDDG